MTLTQYLYDGFLPEDTINYIKDISRTHSFVCEIDKFPNHIQLSKVFENMSYFVQTEDCMGNPCTNKRKGANYARISKNGTESSGFIFFQTKESFDLFVKNFESYITNKKPFQTIF